MKQITTILFLLVTTLVFGSPQMPDLLLIGKDTIFIYQLPIEQLEENKQNELYENISKLSPSDGIPVYMSRGFQGVWLLENDKLYLAELKYVENSQEILKMTFTDKFVDGKVFADWFSGHLVKPKGEMLKWDGVFSRTYYKEELLIFKDGQLIKTKNIENYIDKESTINRIPRQIITDTIFAAINTLNWDKLGERFCDDEYEVIIGKSGRIKKVRFTPSLDTKWENFTYSIENIRCLLIIRRKVKTLKFDKITWQGEPYEEKIRIEIFYNDETKTLENWTE